MERGVNSQKVIKIFLTNTYFFNSYLYYLFNLMIPCEHSLCLHFFTTQKIFFHVLKKLLTYCNDRNTI